VRHNSTLLDLLERWEAAFFLIRIAEGPLPGPPPNAFGHPSKAGSQLVWLGLAYKTRATPPTYMISGRGKEALKLLRHVRDTLYPLARPRLLEPRNEVAEATLEQLDLLLGVTP
jgi:hypothetical protein